MLGVMLTAVALLHLVTPLQRCHPSRGASAPHSWPTVLGLLSIRTAFAGGINGKAAANLPPVWPTPTRIAIRFAATARKKCVDLRMGLRLLRH
jgi:hypothetical protein